MQVGNVTTPFGRRPISLAQIKGQMRTAEIKPGKTADKWKVFRDACEARAVLGIQDRALAVLDALLTFYPDNELSEDRGLVVFPSNDQLSVRAHGIAGTTLRRQLAALVDAGLIQRKDSANGKRYARKDETGGIEEAYGFSLAPLLARAEELAHAAQQVAAERKRFRITKEALSICRRDVRKLISAAIEEGAAGDWGHIEGIFLGLTGRIPRTPTNADLQQILEEMEMLREEIINRLEIHENSQNMSSNAVQNERHIQNSNTESSNELEPRSRNEQGANSSQTSRPASEPIKAFPLGMVLKACPEINDYGPGGAVRSWRDLMSAAVVVRSTLGVSPSAYQDACEVMGQQNAAVAVACILERAGHIHNAGGYLRDLTTKARRGEFSLGPMLMALMRANQGAGRKAG
ncbi:plasmid replication protein RepC [Sinorhizobium meliloti]|uniref:plasmid replication protein RepC n=1 Tax=Rhizobium meliloti TaxID=382 RepID=UPI000FD9D81F|nr:plasmid replication protein RepC [Sinorhizobium meliloti]RVH05156.1 replication initiation protein RepC [Sinorhizobium meliloti]RVH16540.1 replication initiation protein RepC [Sinorhizobium meliloti]RVH28120.1 replication initiation protein RepC [Sinorhizobium meliloti]RVH53116.1 replication initiation protein RepC [Sinorhizobium meliloti]